MCWARSSRATSTPSPWSARVAARTTDSRWRTASPTSSATRASASSAGSPAASTPPPTRARSRATDAPSPCSAAPSTNSTPKENAELARQIVKYGAVISEFPFGTAPGRTTFPMRNRIVTGLSMGILVVEASRQSGAMISVDEASSQGRLVFAVPGRIDNPGASGCHMLIKQGAKLVEDVRDITEEFEYLAISSPAGADAAAPNEEDTRPVPTLSGPEQQILDALEAGALDVDFAHPRRQARSRAGQRPAHRPRDEASRQDAAGPHRRAGELRRRTTPGRVAKSFFPNRRFESVHGRRTVCSMLRFRSLSFSVLLAPMFVGGALRGADADFAKHIAPLPRTALRGLPRAREAEVPDPLRTASRATGSGTSTCGPRCTRCWPAARCRRRRSRSRARPRPRRCWPGSSGSSAACGSVAPVGSTAANSRPRCGI